MAIITISRGSYSVGREIAEKTAEKMGYACLSREDLLQTSEEFNIPEIKLIRAFEDGPSILNRFTHGKEKYIAYIQASLLNHLKKDNIVYHGFAFHFFVRDLSQVLKVRIVEELEARLKIVMLRDKVSRKEAQRFVRKLDEGRRKWSRWLYGIDPRDPNLYDLVIRIDRIQVDDAVNTICAVAGLHQFQTTPESQRVMMDVSLASEVKSALVEIKPEIDVTAESGMVYVMTDPQAVQNMNLVKKMEGAGKAIRGVREINVVAAKGHSQGSHRVREQFSKSTKDTIHSYFGELG
jgi:cytidylate kinase